MFWLKRGVKKSSAFFHMVAGASEDVPVETMAAQAPDPSQVPVPDVSPEEEALLFGQAGQTTSRPQEAPNPFESPPATPAQAQASPAGSQAGGTLPTASGGGTETGFQAIVLKCYVSRTSLHLSSCVSKGRLLNRTSS